MNLDKARALAIEGDHEAMMKEVVSQAGNLDDLNKTKEYFNDKPLSLYKVTSEITYKLDNNFLKFNPSKKNISDKSKRAKELNGLIPPNFQNTENETIESTTGLK